MTDGVPRGGRDPADYGRASGLMFVTFVAAGAYLLAGPAGAAVVVAVVGIAGALARWLG